MVVKWTHDESKHQHKDQAKTEVTVINETSETSSNEHLEFTLTNGKCCEGELLKASEELSDNTKSETQSNFIVSADIHHNEISAEVTNEKTSSASSDNISKDNKNVDYLYRNINGGCYTGVTNGDKMVRTCKITYKKSAKVSMLIHRHTL